jgi:hypothetical protein
MSILGGGLGGNFTPFSGDDPALAVQANYNAQLAQHAQQLANTGPQGGWADSPHHKARELFIRRMGGVLHTFLLAPNDFLHCQVFQEDVFVFYLFGGREGVVCEPVLDFPSDKLIAQFRILVGS